MVLGARASTAACVLTLLVALSGSTVDAQSNAPAKRVKPAPIIIKFDKHSAHAVDFMVRRNKDRSLDAEIAKKGLDLAFTEWMQKDHPFVFGESCFNQVGELAKDYRDTRHMTDFDALVANRTDLHDQVDRYGHDVAFAEWFRRERPDAYRKHFGLDSNNLPIMSDVLNGNGASITKHKAKR